MARSAGVSTRVVALASLLAAVGSSVSELTVALVVIDPPVGGVVTFTAIDGAGPTSSVARVQVTTWPLGLQVQPMPVALWNAMLPEGRRWDTVTFLASRPPWLVISRV